MPARRAITLVAILVAMLALAGPVGAGSSFDAGYQLTLKFETGESFVMYLVAIRNDSQVAFALLDPEFGDWYYGLGVLDAQQRVTGDIQYADSSKVGRFDLRLEPGTCTGTITLFDVPLTVSGPKFI